METMWNYTAFFGDNDPRYACVAVGAEGCDPGRFGNGACGCGVCREANAMTKAGNTTVPLGAPLPAALFRTNHGFDPYIREHFEWSESPSSNTVFRYFIIHDALKDYEVRPTSGGSGKKQRQAQASDSLCVCVCVCVCMCMCVCVRVRVSSRMLVLPSAWRR
jgi:hypothetical protein